MLPLTYTTKQEDRQRARFAAGEDSLPDESSGSSKFPIFSVPFEIRACIQFLSASKYWHGYPRTFLRMSVSAYGSDCHHGMARPQIADKEDGSRCGG